MRLCPGLHAAEHVHLWPFLQSGDLLELWLFWCFLKLNLSCGTVHSLLTVSRSYYRIPSSFPPKPGDWGSSSSDMNNLGWHFCNACTIYKRESIRLAKKGTRHGFVPHSALRSWRKDTIYSRPEQQRHESWTGYSANISEWIRIVQIHICYMSLDLTCMVRYMYIYIYTYYCISILLSFQLEAYLGLQYFDVLCLIFMKRSRTAPCFRRAYGLWWEGPWLLGWLEDFLSRLWKSLFENKVRGMFHVGDSNVEGDYRLLLKAKEHWLLIRSLLHARLPLPELQVTILGNVLSR